MFHHNLHSPMMADCESEGEDRFALWTKLSLLSSIIDQLSFERDEWKSKLQHAAEQLAEAQRVVAEEARLNASKEKELGSLRSIIEKMTDKLMEREESYEKSLSDRERLNAEVGIERKR